MKTLFKLWISLTKAALYLLAIPFLMLYYFLKFLVKGDV